MNYINVTDMNRPQYAIMEGNLGNVFAVDSLTGRIYAVGELVYSNRNVSATLSSPWALVTGDLKIRRRIK